MNTSNFLFPILIIVCGASSIATWLAIRYLRIIDIPNERSSHSTITPRGGGIGIVVSFLMGVALLAFTNDLPLHERYFFGFFFTTLIVATIAFYDDYKGCPVRFKLAGFLIATVAALSTGIVIEGTFIPYLGEINLGLLAYPLTLLWIFGLTNSYNFMDGLDGMAASTSIVAAAFLALISFQHGSQFIYLAALTLAAGSLGFLIFNLPPAKIFMGDVGSTFLGLCFAIMAVIAARYDHSHISLFVVPMLLLHFIFDTAFTFFRRLFVGEPVLQAHRSHLYQLLNRLGLSHGAVTSIFTMMAFVQGLAAYWASNGTGSERWLIFLPLIALYFIGAIFLTRLARAKGLLQIKSQLASD